MREDLDPRIKREFDALIYSVLDSDKLAESVIKRLHERRRNLVIKVLSGVLAAALIAFGTFNIVNHLSGGTSTITTVQTAGSAGGEGLISIPFAENIQIDGNDPKKSTFDFKVKLIANQSVYFWTHIPDMAPGIEGKLIASAQQADGTFRDFQTYDIGSGSARQEIRTFGDGIYRYRLVITNKSVNTTMSVSIDIRP